MADERNALSFPPPKTLAAFFRMDHRRRVRVGRLAELLAVSAPQLRAILRADGVQLRSDAVEWPEAAAYLFDAWPRARIIDALGPDLAAVIPAAFHPAPVPWAIPVFITRAIGHQAALMHSSDPRVHPATTAHRFTSPAVDDYVADILYNEIQPATVAALAHDAAFLEAYSYPPVD